MSRFNVGGTSQWLSQLSKGLKDNGIQTQLLIGDCPREETEDSSLALIPHKRIPGLGPKKSPLQTIVAFLEIRRCIKEYRPDIVNTHTSKAGVIGRLAATTVRDKPKIVHTFHGHIFFGYFNPFMELMIKILERYLGKFTDFFLVSGEKVLQDLLKAKVVRVDSCLTVWPAVPEFDLVSEEGVRSKLGIGEQTVVVGWLGRKVPIKRLDRVLETAAKCKNAIFLIAGDGELVRNTYKDLIDRNSITNFIELGYSTPPNFWSLADICIMTSDNEAIPISPIEASLAGKPVVAVSAGSTNEVVLDGQTGFLCDSDVDQLATAINRLISDKDLRLTMGLSAKEFAKAKFAPSASVSRQIQGYRSALECSSNRR